MSLIHWWPLNGNLNDYGLLNNSLISVGAISNISGKIGHCYYFVNTSHQYLYFNDSNFMDTYINNHSFSLACWVKTNGAGVTPLFGLTYGVCLSGASPRFILSNSSRDIVVNSNTNIADNAWHHICASYNVSNNEMNIYIDGVLKGTGSYPAGYTYSSSWNNMNSIGRDLNNSTDDYFLNGYLNDVRIYDHALSLKEVKEISKGLVLHYNFEDVASKNLLYDNKSVANAEGCNLAMTEYVYNGIKGIRLTKTTTANWHSFLRWTTNYQILDTSKKYSFSVEAVSLNGNNQTINNFFANDNSNNVFIYGTDKTITSTLQRFEWPNLTPNTNFSTTTNVNNVGWHFNVSATNFDIFIANPKFEACDTCTVFTDYMTSSNNSSDSISGTKVYDSSGYSYNGTINGDLQLSSDSICGKKSLQFGSNKYIEIPLLPSFYAATYSFWVKLDSAENAYRSIFIPEGSPTGGGIWLSANTEEGGIWTYQGGNAPNYCGKKDTPLLSANTWYLYTYVFNNGVGQCYLNGEAVGNSTTYTTRSYINTNTYTLGDSYLGTSWNGAPFNGKIADFKIYATALLADDVKAEYNRKAAIDKKGNLFTGEIIETAGSATKIDKNNFINSNLFATTMTLEDGSLWVPICIHYVPDGLFTGANQTFYYTGRNIWENFGAINDLERPESSQWEFYVMQQSTIHGVFPTYSFM